jgi:hypothetical protein
VVGKREVWLQAIDPSAGAMLAITDGWVSPSYGVRVKTRVVVVTWRTRLPVQASYRIGRGRLAALALRSVAAALPARPWGDASFAANTQN